jgi:hypothetical protein
MPTAFLKVRATSADAEDRPRFDAWYAKEHLPDALQALEARRAWRCWSRTAPTAHVAFYKFPTPRGPRLPRPRPPSAR